MGGLGASAHATLSQRLAERHSGLSMVGLFAFEVRELKDQEPHVTVWAGLYSTESALTPCFLRG